MFTLTGTVITSRPRDEVFAYVADFSTSAEWDPGIAAARRVAGDGGVGTTYAVTATFNGREVAMTYEVTEQVAPERIVLQGTGAAVTAVDTIEVFDREGGARVEYRAELALKGIMRLAAPFLGGAMRRLGERAIGGLEAALND
jgi:carbon monoxide dehydrogenase subunit G